MPNDLSKDKIKASNGDVMKSGNQTNRELNLIYKKVFEVLRNSPFAVIFINESDEITYVSPKFTELLGYTINDIPDTKSWFKKAFRSKHDADYAEAEWTKDTVEKTGSIDSKSFLVLDKNKNEKIIKFSVIVTEVKSKFVFFEDITERKISEEKIIESEEKFRSIVENSQSGIIIVGGDYLFNYVNAKFCEILGYSSSELIGRDFRDFLHESSKQLVADRYKKRQRGEDVPSVYQFKLVNKSGDIRTVQISSAVTRDKKGGILTIAQMLDITDREYAEKKLIESETKYRRLFETAGDAIFILKDDLFIDCNSKTLELFNCTKEQIIGKPPYMFSPEKQYDGLSSKKKALLKINGAKSGVPQHFEWIHKKYSGELFDAEVSLNKVRIEGEDLLQAIVRDISERKKTEKHFEIRSRIEKTINEISSAFISVPFEKIDNSITSAIKKIVNLTSCDEGLLAEFSPDYKKIIYTHRWSRSENTESFYEIDTKSIKWWSLQMLNRKTVSVSNTFDLPQSADAEKKMFDAMGIKSIIDIPLVYNEKVIGFLGFNSKSGPLEFLPGEISLFNMLGQIFVNLLQRKKTEKNLRESEERLELALRGAELGLWDWEVQTGKIIFNENWAKILGYKLAEIKPSFESWQKLIHDEDYKKFRSAINDNLKGKTSFYEFEYRMKTKSGKWKWILDRGKVLQRDPNGKAVRAAGTILDITDKKSAEEALTKSEERFRSLFENSAFGIYQTTIEGKFELCNSSFLKIFGYKSFSEIADKDCSKSFYFSPKDREQFLVELFAKGKIEGKEVHYKNSKGLYVYVREFARIVNVNGKKLIEGAVEDISDKKLAELALLKAKEKAEESDKLKSEFLAQMSHEIRTPINTILSFSGLIKEELTGRLSSELEDSFGVMSRAGKRIIRTIDLLLDMSQLQTSTYEINYKKMDAYQKVIKDIADEYYYTAKEKKLKFEVVKKNENNIIIGDEYTVGQILHNLINNAIKYTHKGYVKVIIGKEKNNNVYIKVADSGIGISEDYLPNIFKPFTQEDQGYTRQYEGNGLGLALVKSYCELNNAEISVTSKKGKGTTFKILFKEEK